MLKICNKRALIISLRFLFLIIATNCTLAVHAQNQVAFAKQYVSENARMYNLSLPDIEDMRVTAEYLSPTTGWYHIYFNQTLQSIDVYNAVFGVTIKDNKVAYATNSFVAELFDKMPAGRDEAKLTAKDALQKAVIDLATNGIDISQTKQIDEHRLANGKIDKQVFENKNLSDENIVATLNWLPVENKIGEKINTTISLAWHVKFLTKDTKHSWSIQVDANTGAILQKIDDIIHCDFGTPEHANHNEVCRDNNVTESTASPAANGYTVFDYPLEAPTFGARTIVTNPYTRFLPAGAGPGATNGWHNDGTTNYNYTRGNSVWAKDDIANDNETNIGSYPSSATLDFNFPYTQATGTAALNLNASITNLFYWNNVIHDVLWRYGFDEPSGNFQKDNLGKGGLGNDYVNADAQDGSGTSNANFSTPVDGGNGRMQMYIWSNVGSPLYQPDSDFDNGIISHEYGHGWSIRLTGGPANSSCLQNAEQGGEGWADYNGLMLTTNWAALTPTLASANIPRGIGTYVLGQNPATGIGIRPYRYSYDKATYNNVVTYGKVADATNFSLPHGIGSIWATMLWDMTWEIILEDNIIVPNIYDVPTVITNMRGNVAAYKLVTEGLRLQPCSPSFVQARDAIFQADSMLFAGRYHCAIGRAFARRGLGLNASTGASTNDRLVTESFTSFSSAPLSSLSSNTACSNQPFNYTATVSEPSSFTFEWTRATVAGISNAAASGNTATINEVLINTTTSPITVQYLISVSPDPCGAVVPQNVNVIVTPSVIPTVNAYTVCQNATVPPGQGLVVPASQTNISSGSIVAGPTYNRGIGTTTYIAAAAGAVGANVYFKTISFVAPTTAAVQFTVTAASLTSGAAFDTYMAIYQNTFNSASPATNFLFADDDSGVGAFSQFTQNLTAGTTYIIVMSSYGNIETGTFTLQANSNIFPITHSWYLNATGGTALTTGEVFNPIGIAGSGIPNTATPGTATFYISNSIYPTCRTATTFTIGRNIIYVNQANISGTFNGDTWATAYQNLEDALSSANVCANAQVWVAAGTYKPTTTTNRDISFAMKNNLAVYGGFPNTGTPTFAQRNPAINVTTLSGDIGIANDATDNSYHVINNSPGLNNTAVLDGFVIADGNANGTGNFRNVGAGMLNNAGATAAAVCNPKIDNCIFKNNSASLNGGAIFNNAVNATASPVFTNCVFQNNTAVNGAAFYNDGSNAGASNPVIINASFLGNAASSSGNVAYSTAIGGNSTADFTNCIFWNNGGANTFASNASSINVKYSLLEPMVNNYTNAAGNLTTTVSPFVLSSDAHLKDSSSAIDAGTATGAPANDIEAMVRTAIPDMGSYENLQACFGSNKIYYSDVVGTTYIWQMNDGSGYVDISDGVLYNNTTTQKLTVIAPAANTTGTLYRCKVTTDVTESYSAENTVRFYNRWLGTANNNWQNPANWSCGVIPDQYTDVIIPSAKTIYPITNANNTVRKLQSDTGSILTISAGNNLTILGQ